MTTGLARMASRSENLVLTDGPVWSCGCGAVLEAIGDISLETLDTTCERCQRQYQTYRLAHRAWRVIEIRER